MGDRVHLVPFVDAEVVPLYLRSAGIGFSPLLHAPNHDIAVTNKFCESIGAGLPIITSDTPAPADLVNELDLGAVYTAGDVDDLVRAALTVLADLDRIAKRIADDPQLPYRFSWAAQAEVIRSVYADVMGKLPDAAWAPARPSSVRSSPTRRSRPRPSGAPSERTWRRVLSRSSRCASNHNSYDPFRHQTPLHPNNIEVSWLEATNEDFTQQLLSGQNSSDRISIHTGTSSTSLTAASRKGGCGRLV